MIQATKKWSQEMTGKNPKNRNLTSLYKETGF
jgi:hypothetical protein